MGATPDCAPKMDKEDTWVFGERATSCNRQLWDTEWLSLRHFTKKS